MKKITLYIRLFSEILPLRPGLVLAGFSAWQLRIRTDWYSWRRPPDPPEWGLGVGQMQSFRASQLTVVKLGLLQAFAGLKTHRHTVVQSVHNI